MVNINKIQSLANDKGIKLSFIIKKIGLQGRSYFHDIERYNRDIPDDKLAIIAEILGTSPEYLRDESDNPLPSHKKSVKNLMPLKTKKVPLLGEIACGKPIFADEKHGEYVLANGDLDCDFCLIAKGDSMTGARIYDGDIVFVKQQDTVENGQVAVVLIGDEATLKRVYYYPEKNKMILNPENPIYEPMVYVGEELSEVRILGRAVAFQSVVR